MQEHEAIKYLYQLSSLGWKLGLDKIRQLLSELGDPHHKYKSIHIAGTNGKGSTAAIIESILREAGYKTGLFTSPHLTSVCERIRIDGKQIESDDLIRYINILKPYIEKYQCTFFESITAIGFLYFAEQKIDIAVVEVGLGGRLDATNVIHPVLAIITNIEHDHTRLLGRSRKLIAVEKGGVIKSGIKVLTASKHNDVVKVLSRICEEQGAELLRLPQIAALRNSNLGEDYTSFDMDFSDTVYPALKVALAGEHQIQNAALAVTAAHVLSRDIFHIKHEAIYQGLLNVQWPGRLQVLGHSPKLVVDVAHNPDGLTQTLKAVKEIFTYKKMIAVIGIAKSKNYRSMVRELCRYADLVIAVRPETHRALNPLAISRASRSLNIETVIFDNTVAGLNHAFSIAGSEDLVIGIGSHYTVGEILNHINSS